MSALNAGLALGQLIALIAIAFLLVRIERALRPPEAEGVVQPAPEPITVIEASEWRAVAVRQSGPEAETVAKVLRAHGIATCLQNQHGYPVFPPAYHGTKTEGVYICVRKASLAEAMMLIDTVA